jgi:hypothetical protein
MRNPRPLCSLSEDPPDRRSRTPPEEVIASEERQLARVNLLAMCAHLLSENERKALLAFHKIAGTVPSVARDLGLTPARVYQLAHQAEDRLQQHRKSVESVRW